MKKIKITIVGSILLLLISCTKSNPTPEICLPAFDALDGGSGKFMIVYKPSTPEEIKTERKELITSHLNAGDIIYLGSSELRIHSFWYDADGLKSGIKVQYHDSLVGSHAFENDPLICW